MQHRSVFAHLSITLGSAVHGKILLCRKHVTRPRRILEVPLYCSDSASMICNTPQQLQSKTALRFHVLLDVVASLQRSHVTLNLRQVRIDAQSRFKAIYSLSSLVHVGMAQALA
jgi:hypothetical protein